MSLALNDTTTYLSSLISAGADAMSNLYYATFSGGLIDEELSEALSVRLLNFTPPTFTQGTEQKHFMTTSVSVPNASYTGNKSFTLEFRLDKDYELYKFLKKQKASTASALTTFAGNAVPGEESSESSSTLQIDIKAPVGNLTETLESSDASEFTTLYSFKYCWVTRVSEPSFSYSNAALTVSADISFYQMEKDPQNVL